MHGSRSRAATNARSSVAVDDFVGTAFEGRCAESYIANGIDGLYQHRDMER